MTSYRLIGTCLVFSMIAFPMRAEEASRPKEVPPTRPEMKQALERLKQASPRLPLPPVNDEERAAAGGRPLVNNGRMRQRYLPPELRSGDFSREPDPAMSLDPAFKTMLFWIVSRGNNCHYCLGHQEIKLTTAGIPEDRIAALDGDWSQFSEAEQAAFALARKITLEPHRITPADLAPLQRHYSELQTLEIVFALANNNSTNRWTDSLGIPQDADASALQRATGKARVPFITFLTPTSARYQAQVSKVAPLAGVAGAQARPPLESQEEVHAALEQCRSRSPIFAPLDDEAARKVLPRDWPAGAVPAWARLLARFPKAGVVRAAGLRAAAESGSLSPRLKAEIAWVAARQDRAWYAVGIARQRLRALGFDDQAIAQLDGPNPGRTAEEQEALAFARKLTATPRLIADADIARLRKGFSDSAVAEIVLQVCNAAFFDRWTEVTRLPLEE